MVPRSPPLLCQEHALGHTMVHVIRVIWYMVQPSIVNLRPHRDVSHHCSYPCYSESASASLDDIGKPVASTTYKDLCNGCILDSMTPSCRRGGCAPGFHRGFQGRGFSKHEGLDAGCVQAASVSHLTHGRWDSAYVSVCPNRREISNRWREL